MRYQTLKTGALCFVIAFAGTFAALAVFGPGLAIAQQAGWPVTGNSIVDADGLERIRLGTGRLLGGAADLRPGR